MLERRDEIKNENRKGLPQISPSRCFIAETVDCKAMWTNETHGRQALNH